MKLNMQMTVILKTRGDSSSLALGPKSILLSIGLTNHWCRNEGRAGISVTATAHNEIFDAKIRSRSDVPPKHVKGERPVRNRTAKSRKRRPQKKGTSTRDDCIDVYSFCRTRYCAHPWEIDIALVAETRISDACLKIPAVSCVVTSASAGKPRSISIK